MHRLLTHQDTRTAAELEAGLDSDALPAHIGVIMDGNGRWGLAKGVNREYGHHQSVDAMRTAVTAADDLSIGYLSLFCFSTENVSRPTGEVESLFRLFDEVLEHEPERLNSRNIRIVISGMVGLLPAPLPRKFEQAVELTADNTGLVLNLCVMYSGRSEIIEAAKLAAADIAAGKLEPDALDERRFSRYLYQPGLPDVDLVVRTSGEVRISNFLLWQMAYAELVFTDVLWPDFTRRDFMLALDTYQQRVRRFGRV